MLEHFFDNDIHAGDVYESKFILGQYPYIFKCGVSGPAMQLKPFNTKAYQIDVTTFDGLLKDSRGLPKVRKRKGGIRYKWYLTLNMELAQGG